MSTLKGVAHSPLLFILLSTLGGQASYLMAELGLMDVPYELPLALIAGFELAADLSLLRSIWRERSGDAPPLPGAMGAVEEERGPWWAWVMNVQRRLLVWLLALGAVTLFSYGFATCVFTPPWAVYTLGGLTCYFQVCVERNDWAEGGRGGRHTCTPLLSCTYPPLCRFSSICIVRSNTEIESESDKEN